MIEVKNLAKGFPQGKVVFRQVHLSIGRGDYVFITGPSGAGKTSLLQVIYGFCPPLEGEVFVDGKSLYYLKSLERAALRRKMGFVFQDFRLIPHFTVEENVRLPLEIQGMSARNIIVEVDRVLARTGLKDLRHEVAQTLSGGEQQRVAVARAIIHRPEWLFADEPTGNLDPRSANDLMRLFQEIHAGGTSVVVATHDENMVRQGRGICYRLEGGGIRGSQLC